MFKKKEKTVELLVSCQTCGYTSSNSSSCPNCNVELKSQTAPASLPAAQSRMDGPPKTEEKRAITMAGTDRPVEYAGFARRAFALLIDQAVILGVQWFFLAPAALYIVYNSLLGGLIFGLGFFAMVVVQYWIYTAFFEHSRWQATPGKFLVGLQVTDLSGSPLTFWRSSWRLVIQYLLLFLLYLLFAFSIRMAATSGFHHEIDSELTKAAGYLIALLIGYCHVLFSDKKQTLFDRAAQRLVVFQPGYANSQQMTTFECFRRSVAMIPQQMKKFAAIAMEKKPGAKLFLAASLMVAVYAWSFFAIFQITQNAILVEQQIANAKGEDMQKPKVALQHMESVYSTLEGMAGKLGLRGLELELHNRNILFSNNPYLILGRAQKYIDAKRPELAEKDIRAALRNQSAESDYRFRSTAFSTQAQDKLSQGDQKEAVNSCIRALKANPFNLDALDVLDKVDQKYIANKSIKKLAGDAFRDRPAEASFTDTRHRGEMLEIGFNDNKEIMEDKLKQCDRVIALMPDCTQALLTKAQVLVRLNRQKESEKYFLGAIASDPTSNRPLSEFMDSATTAENEVALSRLRSIAKMSEHPEIRSRLAHEISESAFGVDDVEKRKEIYRDALKEINLAVKARPNNREYLTERADIFGNLDQHSEAIRDYKEALKFPIVEQVTTLSKSDGIVYSSIASQYDEMGKFDEALKQYDQAIAIEPDNSSGYEFKGDMLLKLQRYNEAIAAFDKAIEIKQDIKNIASEKITDFFLSRVIPKETLKDSSLEQINSGFLASMYSKRGQAYEQLGEIDKALSSYEKASSLEKSAGSENVDNQKKVAHLYLMKGTPQKAIEAYNHHLANNKSAVQSDYLSRAILLEEVGRTAEAQTDRQKAIALSQKSLAKEKTADNYRDCAEVYFVLKDYPKAIQYIDKAIKIDQADESYTLVPKAQVLAAQKKLPEALALVEKASKKNCSCQLSERGDVYITCGKFKQAETLLTEKIKDDPLDARAHYRRSLAYKHLGQNEKSVADLEKAKLLGYEKDPLLRMDEF